MAQYAINSSAETYNTHRVLIGGPLVFALLFSFGFVLLHPGGYGQAHSTAASQQTHTGSTGDEPTNLPPISLAPTALPTLSTVPAVSGDDTSNGSPATATPQTGSDGGSAHGNSSPQSVATQDHHDAGAGIPLVNNVKGVLFRN